MGDRPAAAGAGDQQVREPGVLAAGVPPQPVARRAGDASVAGSSMADTPVRSRRPYLLRAMHEWISDSNQTPHIVVDASMEGVEVPRQYVQGGKIILNVSTNATSMLNLGIEIVRFRARFGAATYDA